MNTTVNINLSGMAFIINEDAYKSLQQYIHSFEEKYDDKEIAKDIESRLAELFTDYLSKLGRQVIDMEDVKRAIEQIGEPDFEEQTERTAEQPKKRVRKFYRDPLNCIIGGVSSGIATYAGIDTSLVRLLWVLLFILCTPIAALVYLLMWIIIPEAKTPTQRLEMQGLDITTENLQNESANIIANRGNNGCLSLLGKTFIILSVLCLVFPLFFVILLLPIMLIGVTGVVTAAPLFSGVSAAFAIAAILAIILCPLIALIYFLTGLRNGDNNKKSRVWVYPVLAALFIAGIIYICVNIDTFKKNIENWGETVGNVFDDTLPDDRYIDDSYYADIDSFTITLQTVYCGDYVPAVSGTANRWGISAMHRVSDSVWVVRIPSDAYNEIKFQDTKGNWSNEIEYYDAETQSWQKLSNIHLSPNPDQRFDFTCPQLYRWSGCHK
ncbi:MAG: PspC domain-containing protein [Paludibacteraceae bacterium]|nr:PspC domain-containing protein [Paludibacteraceae bacterium]